MAHKVSLPKKGLPTDSALEGTCVIPCIPQDGSGKTACAAYLSSRYVAASSATCTIHARENC